MLITTAIDYTNGAPHIGHAYEKILADVLARYQRMRGDEVYYLTGVDQHGQKVQQTAEKEGINPATFANKKTKLFLNLWKKLGLQYDGWAATTGVCCTIMARRSRDANGVGLILSEWKRFWHLEGVCKYARCCTVVCGTSAMERAVGSRLNI